MASHLTPVLSSLFLPISPSGDYPFLSPFLLDSHPFRLVTRTCYEIWITKCTGDGARSSVTGRRKLLMWGTRRRRSPTWPRFFNALWCDVRLFEHPAEGEGWWRDIGSRYQDSDSLCEVESYFRYAELRYNDFYTCSLFTWRRINSHADLRKIRSIYLAIIFNK